jgi:sucrose-6-phosphate hydrolase SacC (GH32 family)
MKTMRLLRHAKVIWVERGNKKRVYAPTAASQKRAIDLFLREDAKDWSKYKRRKFNVASTTGF